MVPMSHGLSTPSASSLTGRIAATWRSLSLARQFALAGSAVLCAGMAILGAWVSDRIQRDVLQNTVAATAVYMHSFVEPLVQDLKDAPELSPGAIDAFRRMLDGTPLGKRIISIKIWSPDGRILFSRDAAMIGRSFQVSDDLRKALAGEIVGSLDELTEDENASERQLGMPLFEIYVPMHAAGSDRIIAVAEFYTSATTFFRDVNRAVLQSWMVVALVALGMGGALFGIVLRGSRTIDQQQVALKERIEDLSALLARNEELREGLADARRRSAETNEQLLRRLGAELHDGPAQLIGLALLRLDGLRRIVLEHLDDKQQKNADIIRTALQDALEEIRNLSAGVAPPELEGTPLRDTLLLAARNHERRTGTIVSVEVDPLPHEKLGRPQDLRLSLRPGGAEQRLQACRRQGPVADGARPRRKSRRRGFRRRSRLSRRAGAPGQPRSRRPARPRRDARRPSHRRERSRPRQPPLHPDSVVQRRARACLTRSASPSSTIIRSSAKASPIRSKGPEASRSSPRGPARPTPSESPPRTGPT